MIANLYLYQFAIGYWQTLFYLNNVGPSVKACIQIVLFDTVLLVSLTKIINKIRLCKRCTPFAPLFVPISHLPKTAVFAAYSA